MIWHDRNKFVFGGLKLDPSLSMAKAQAINEAFRRPQFPEMLKEKKLQKKDKKLWAPLLQGWLKINVDASTDTKR